MQAEAKIIPPLPSDLFFLLDPDQRRAVQMATGSENTWVYGADHQKRLQVMLHLIMSRIFEGSTVLICAGEETQEQLREMLNKAGLDHAHFHLRKPVPPKGMAALQLARKKAVKENTDSATALALEQYQRWNENIAAGYSATNRKIFGDLTWQQLAEKAATGPNPIYKGLLAASLDSGAFKMTLKEYWNIRGRIKTFQRLRVLRTSSFDHLDALHDSCFETVDESELRKTVSAKLDDIILRGRRLLASIGSLIHQYRLDVSGRHYQALHALRCEIERIEELVEQGTAKFGEGFLAESTFLEITGKLKKSISRKYQAMSAARGTIATKLEELLGALDRTEFKPTQKFEWLDGQGLENIREQLEGIKAYLAAKTAEIDSQATDQRKRMNARNISASHGLLAEIQNVETEIEQFAKWVNDSELLRTPIEINALSIEKRSAVIRETISTCCRLKEAMTDFEAYCLWRNFWLKQPEYMCTLLESLDILDEDCQMDAFDSWYLDNVLDQVPESHMMTGVLPVAERKSKLRDIRAVVAHHIKLKLQQRRHETIRAIRSKAKALCNAISSSRLNTVSDELHILPAQSLCKLFPVVFCTPGQLRDYAYYFDTLLVSDLNVGDYLAYQAQSKQCVLVTRSMPGGIQAMHKDLRVVRLGITSVGQAFKWNNIPASDRLQKLNALASQFSPYTPEMKLYHCRDIQIFSFLGDIADSFLLKNLNTPYQVVTGEDSLEVKQITEAFLDSRKPIVVLTRDGIMEFARGKDLFWQNSALEFLRSCGVGVIDSKSIDLKRRGLPAMEELCRRVDGIRHQLERDGEAVATA